MRIPSHQRLGSSFSLDEAQSVALRGGASDAWNYREGGILVPLRSLIRDKKKKIEGETGVAYLKETTQHVLSGRHTHQNKSLSAHLPHALQASKLRAIMSFL